MRHYIHYAESVSELSGRGEELLIDNEGNIRAHFVDGNIVKSERQHLVDVDNDETVTLI